ncbi:Multiple epidermal growth factor-like domains protein 8 [Mortierella sp. NVP41]|nr:Multiple epidermal growth factor-like domains protein 8 [Mortierella sp. NVP41]
MIPIAHSNNRFAVQQEDQVSSVLCNTETPTRLSGVNGTFESNKLEDGIYPKGARSCTWTISIPNDGTATAGPSIIDLTFWTSIQLACGKDSVTIYDGPDTLSPVVAMLCGNHWYENKLPRFFSSGSQLTVVFTKSADSPAAPGFRAHWSSTSPCSICLYNNRGTCNANTCVCTPSYTGSVCQKETAGFKAFTPRSQHSMAYDATKDMVYITGGTTAHDRSVYMWDMLTYSFATNKWNSITTPQSKPPGPRYGHFSFVHKSNLYIYGGVASYDAVADVWMYDGKVWSKQQPTNLEKMPTGTIGAACVFFTSDNQTRLAVFGGMTTAGVTVRELHFYDIETRQWSRSDHQNSVGLSGASAVFHEATNSIYYFGGLVNQTIRNTIPYQYSIDQDLWFALAPRFDPLASLPSGWNGTHTILRDVEYPDDPSTNDPKGDGSRNSTVSTLQNLAMYDTLSGVWAPAGLMGSDTVVFYGGMRPFGLGSRKEQSCFVGSMYLYDLSCQKWSSYDISDPLKVVRYRVNHTMVLRPPGAPGGSKTDYTAYIFGGFDGSDRNDMVNITINKYPSSPSTVNRCRALRWCSMYDDCQNCNPHYCSYVDGLCLFDTDKAKAKTASTSAPILLGESADIPVNGTLQNLLLQRPDLKTKVLKLDTCPLRIPLNLKASYSGVIAAGDTLTFKTYIDAQDLDIQFDIDTNPKDELEFQSLNVWEGFMNMYWRADHEISDSSWDDGAGVPSLRPDDLPPNNNLSDWDRPLVNSGTLSVGELAHRWTKYSGLDGSPSQSALRGSSAKGIYFSASDPRRFSGYYVYSLKNPTKTPITMTLTVNVLNRPEDEDANKESQLDLATLGFFMVGFILGVLLLIILGRKLRRVIAERDEAQWAAAELRVMEELEAMDQRGAAPGFQTNLAMAGGGGGMDQDYVEKKPMYRVIVGVQQEKEALLRALTPPGLALNTLRQRAVRKNESSPLGRADSVVRPVSSMLSGDLSRIDGEDVAESHQGVRRKSDFIRDLGSSPPGLGGHHRLSVIISGVRDEPATVDIQRRHTHSENTRNGSGTSVSSGGPLSGLQRGLSLGKLKGSGSLKRFLDHSRVQPEEKEVLTQTAQGESLGDVFTRSELDQSQSSNYQPGASRRRGLERTDSDMSTSLMARDIPWRRLRNPIMVQPISVEPLPFHGRLVPNTRRQYRRYRRSLQRRQQQQQDQHSQTQQQRTQQLRTTVSRTGSSSRLPFSAARSFSRRNGLQPSLSTRSQGSLREAHRAASRMVLRSAGDSPASGNAMEMVPLGGSSYNSQDSTTIDGWQDEYEDYTSKAAGTAGVNGSGNQDVSGGSEASMTDDAVRMRGRQEYEPGPLLALNVLIVFPGDVGTRAVLRIGDDEEEDGEKEEGKKAVRNAEEDEDRRSQNTLYNSNIIMGATGSSSTGTSGTSGHSSQGSTSSSDTGNTSDAIDTEQRLPPMAIGTVFVPDPVRWWAFKAQQQVDRRRFERDLRRMWAHQQQQQQRQQQKSRDPK